MSMLDTSTTARRIGRTGRTLTALSVSAAFLVLGGLRIWAHRESAPMSAKPSLQQTETLPQEAVRARLGDFYRTLEALDFQNALEYFSGVPDAAAAVRVPVFLVRKIEEKNGWELTLPSAESFVSLAAESRILAVEPDGEGWLVTEELTISRKTKSGVRQILVRNPNHRLKFVRDGDQWKIDGRKRIDISPKPVEGSKLHVGLAFGMDGINCLWIESPKVLEPPGWRKAALIPKKTPSVF